MSRWWWRGLATAVAFGAVFVAAVLLELDPHPGRLLVVVLVVMACVGLALDTVTDPPPRWRGAGSAQAEGRGDWRDHDDRTAFLLRLVESHLSARVDDPVLGAALARLAASTVEVRHGLRADSAEGRNRLGPELVALLDRPPPRLSRTDVGRYLERIEDL